MLWTASRIAARLPERLAADRARMFERDRISLLRHDAAALHELIPEPEIAEFAGAPEQEILNDTTKSRQEDRNSRNAFQQIVDRCNAAVRVAGWTVEAEQIARSLTIDGKARPGDRARPERISIRARIRGAQPHGIAFQLLDDRVKVMRDRGRLRRLRMGMRGKYRFASARQLVREARHAAESPPSDNDRISARCCMRYIVISMSFRDRAVCRRPAASSPQRAR